MSKHVTTCTWQDVPHLSEAVQAELLAAIPPHQRDARSKGVPQLGSGAIYGFPESDIKVPDFQIPTHWKRAFGLDAGGGAKPTAAAWGAVDPEGLALYIYSVYRRDSPELAVHIEALKARGLWIPGVGDASALIVTAHDAEQLISAYQRAGVDIILPDKAVESGIQSVWDLMTADRFKVFASCTGWFEEYRLYRRDEKGRIVKERDHLMDATRYLVHTGLKRAKSPRDDAERDARIEALFQQGGSGGGSWMAR